MNSLYEIQSIQAKLNILQRQIGLTDNEYTARRIGMQCGMLRKKLRQLRSHEQYIKRAAQPELIGQRPRMGRGETGFKVEGE